MKPNIHPYIIEAYSVLEGRVLSKDQALSLSRLGGQDILDLMALANKVKNKYVPDLKTCTIMNAKSGACAEDCRFCAQSNYHSSEIEIYPLASLETMLAQASQAYQNGVRRFGLVVSGTGYTVCNSEFRNLISGIETIRSEYPDMAICASFGILSEETVTALADSGLACYNINLQVNPGQYEKLVSTTHAVEDRLQTIRLLKKYGIKICSGGIIGLGESMEDRIELALALKDLDVDVIPLNVLIPIAGTQLENQAPTPLTEIAKTIALFRLLHPAKTIKLAAGRETRLKDFQGLLMLAGANGFLTGGYLTTRGRDISEDQALQQELEGFHVP
ncbi:biotin synthase BioB [bacterium]|nr:biotin synthase BioB [bacterium]